MGVDRGDVSRCRRRIGELRGHTWLDHEHRTSHSARIKIRSKRNRIQSSGVREHQGPSIKGCGSIGRRSVKGVADLGIRSRTC